MGFNRCALCKRTGAQGAKRRRATVRRHAKLGGHCVVIGACGAWRCARLLICCVNRHGLCCNRSLCALAAIRRHKTDIVGVSRHLISSLMPHPSCLLHLNCRRRRHLNLITHHSSPITRFFPFTYTISTAISAGETPEMRAAWPRDTGRILSSFWRASMEIPSRWR